MQALKDLWWLAAALMGVLAYCVRVGWRVRELIARIERLERHDRTQREDLNVIMRGTYATLCGLKEQGCNGEVTKALDLLRTRIYDTGESPTNERRMENAQM